jgi:drug/metabolite transporter (DMT)-like permease
MNAGIFAAAAVALLWAVSSLCYSFAGKRIGSGAVNHVRLWLALALTALAQLTLTGRLLPQAAGVRQLAFLAASGLIGYVLGDAFLFEAFVRLGARTTMLIMTSVPIFGAFLGLVVLGEQLSAWKTAMIAVTLAGIAIVVAGPAAGADPDAKPAREHRLWGVACAFGGAVGQAGGLLLSKLALQEGMSPVAANLVRLTAGSFGMGLWAAVSGRAAADFRAASVPRTALLVLAGTLAGPFLGVALSLYAVARVEIGVASTLMQTSPILLLPLSRLAAGERITARAAAGTAVAVAGAAGLFFAG